MANFTPTLAPIHEKSPFRFWCQKVLPTVYDDSLSYYELLTKVVYYLNENTQDLETVNSNVEALYNSYVELQNYVNNYFDQNFPELVQERLDEMVEDGTFDAMLHTIVDPYFELKSEEIDDAIDAQNDNIEVLQNQWDNFIEHHAGLTTEDVIWTGVAFAKNDVIELEEPYNDYVYLDVYYAVSGSSACTVYRIPVDEITKVNGYRLNHTYPAETTETDKTLITNSIVIKKVFVDPTALTPVIDYEKLQITSAGHWSWDGDSLNSATIQYEPEASQQSTFIAGTIWKIIGVKNEQNDAEVIDARTGYNGTVYQTLGQAIRTQVENLENQITYIEAGSLLINIDGTTYPVKKVEKTTVDGVQGWKWTLEDGTLDNMAFFFADGTGLNAVKQQIESEIPDISSITLSIVSGSPANPYTYGVITITDKEGTVTTLNVGAIDPSTNKLYADSVPTKSTVVSGNKEPINAIALINYAGKKIAKNTVSGTTVTQELTENTFYVFGEVTSLTVTLATPADANIMNEYHFRFTSGATPAVLTLPAGVTMNETLTVEANKTYEVSIIDNYGVWCAW